VVEGSLRPPSAKHRRTRSRGGQRVWTGPVLLVDVIVKGSTVGVFARRGEREEFECCTWAELERAESNINPIEAVGR
jgi:hypothetical protein